MGEAAAPRRAKAKIGDFTFCLLAAGLGLGLLLATGRHLFGSPYAVPQTAALQVADNGASRSGSGHAATNAQLRALAKARPLPIAAVPNRQFLARGVAPARASRQALRPHRRVGRHEGTGASSRPKLLPRSPGASRAPKATGRSIRLRVAAAAPRYRRSRVPEHAPVVPRPRTVSPKRPGLSAPPKRGKAQATAARAHAIVEPPLGYEVTPALLIAPGAERLDLGTAAVPTIAPRRRH